MPIMAIVGGRGIGKTYSVKTYCFKNVLKSHGKDKIIWLRSTEKMCETLKLEKGQALLKDAILNSEFGNDFEYEIDGDNTINMICDDNEKITIGYLMSLSGFYKYKGNSFADVKYIVYDEFISENSEIVRGDRVLQFLNTLETVCRNRNDVKIFMLSNSLNLNDDLLQLIAPKIKAGKYGFYKNAERNSICWYVKSSAEYVEKKKESIVGKLIVGTHYEDTMINNNFLTYDFEYFERMPKDAVELCLIMNKNYKIMLYRKDELIFTKHYLGKRTNGYCADNVEKLEGCFPLPKQFKKTLIELHNNNLVKFENENCRFNFLLILGLV